MHDVCPAKYYKNEGFVERTLRIDEEELEDILCDYFARQADVDLGQVRIVESRPKSISLYVTCRQYVDPLELPSHASADFEIEDHYDENNDECVAF